MEELASCNPVACAAGKEISNIFSLEIELKSREELSEGFLLYCTVLYCTVAVSHRNTVDPKTCACCDVVDGQIMT